MSMNMLPQGTALKPSSVSHNFAWSAAPPNARWSLKQSRLK